MEILRAPFLISSSNLNIFAPQTRYNMELNEHNKAEYPPMHTRRCIQISLTHPKPYSCITILIYRYLLTQISIEICLE